MRRYFVIDIHRASDACAMERELVEWARSIYMNVLVKEDSIYKIAVKVSNEQLRILNEKPRRQPVLVDWGINELVNGHAYVRIGTSQISLALVQGEVL